MVGRSRRERRLTRESPLDAARGRTRVVFRVCGGAGGSWRGGGGGRGRGGGGGRGRGGGGGRDGGRGRCEGGGEKECCGEPMTCQGPVALRVGHRRASPRYFWSEQTFL